MTHSRFVFEDINTHMFLRQNHNIKKYKKMKGFITKH